MRLPGQGGKTGVVPRGASRWRFGILGRPKSCAKLLSWSQEIGSQCVGTQMAVPKSRGAIDRVLASLSARARMRWVRGVQRNRQLKMFKARADQCQCPTIPLASDSSFSAHVNLGRPPNRPNLGANTKGMLTT